MSSQSFGRQGPSGADTPPSNTPPLLRQPSLLRRSKSERLTAHLQAWPGWGHAQQVLSKMVDGYGMHLEARKDIARQGDGDGRISPMWTDLTMWAVLAGQPA